MNEVAIPAIVVNRLRAVVDVGIRNSMVGLDRIGSECGTCGDGGVSTTGEECKTVPYCALLEEPLGSPSGSSFGSVWVVSSLEEGSLEIRWDNWSFSTCPVVRSGPGMASLKGATDIGPDIALRRAARDWYCGLIRLCLVLETMYSHFTRKNRLCSVRICENQISKRTYFLTNTTIQDTKVISPWKPISQRNLRQCCYYELLSWGKTVKLVERR